MNKITRVEVIERSVGRVYTNYNVSDAWFDIQDDGHTLKVFVNEPKPDNVETTVINNAKKSERVNSTQYIMKTATYIIVAALLWAHIAPNVYSWINAKPVASAIGCERDYVFYVTELSFDTFIRCPEVD